jgi:hypothetical protein
MKKTLLLFVTLLTVTLINAQTVGDLFTVDNIDYEVTVVDSPNQVQVNTSTLTAVTIPATISNGGVDYNVTLIKPGAWRDSNTTTITSLTVLGDTEIGLQAFMGCTNLVSADLSQVTKRVGNSAFKGCNSLTTVDLSSLSEALGQNAFQNCTSLATIDVGNVTEIGTQVFTGAQITSIDLPSTTLIGNLAFFNCDKLASINIPVVEQINTGAFNNTALTSITFPATLTTLIETNYNMFKNCTALKTITVLGETPIALTYNSAVAGESLFINAETSLSVTNLIVPAGTGAAYFAADVWKDLSITEAAVASVNSIDKISLRPYPNPVVNNLYFSSNDVYSVEIYNILGAKVSSQKVIDGVDMTQLNEGIYFIKAKNSEGLDFKTIKVIKQ